MTEHEASDVETVEEMDAQAQLWESVADGLAMLSESPDTPTGVGGPTSMFSSSDVDFGTDSWITRLSDVQDWLYFSSTLPTKSREDFLDALTAELGLAPAEAFDPNDQVKSLSVKALEKLSQRIDTAVRLQQEFMEDLESKGVSRADASRTWSDAWAEEDTDGQQPTMTPVSAKAAVWPIFQFTRKKLNLTPSYQRGDVWRPSDRQALIESILRGIPLPSLILLRTKGPMTHEVVDGKQRLTAILRFVGAHPVALDVVKRANARHPDAGLLNLFQTDYPRFRRAWKAIEHEDLTTKLEDSYFFPFKLRNNGDGGLVGEYLEPLQGKYYTQIKARTIRVSSQVLEVEELFEGAPDYEIPVIEYTEATQRQIHEVFKLYNKQGVHLNAEEIRNAVYHEVALTPAMLFAAGDADARVNALDIAPALALIPNLSQLGETLRNYGFGDSRYKRTKVLSWIIAVLLHDTEGKPLTSTARHIDQLLNQVQTTPNHPLRSDSTLADLFTWIAGAAELHAGHDELWAESFMDDDKGLKWQELQLVGSLVGIAFALAAAPGDIEDRIDANADAIRHASATQWERIQKAQTKTQWDYIRRIATGVVELLGIDPADASRAVRDRFGSSGFESLQGMVLAVETD